MSIKQRKQKRSRSLDAAELRRRERFYPDLSAPMIFAFAEAVSLFVICALLNIFVKTEKNTEIINMILFSALPLYLCTAGVVCLVYAIRSRRTHRARIESARFETEIYDMFRTVIDLPYAISDSSGKVMIINGALSDVLGFKSAVSGIPLSDFCSVPIKTLISEAKNREFYLTETIYELPEELELHESSVTRLADGRRYEAISYVFKLDGDNYYFIVFRAIED